jgi:hypothetical protein
MEEAGAGAGAAALLSLEEMKVVRAAAAMRDR